MSEAIKAPWQQLEELKTYRGPRFAYNSDIQQFAKTADGPFSTRIPNASRSALLYATVPNPTRPVDITTSLNPILSR